MKTAKQWQDELAGETSVESIQQIQRDALNQAIIIVNQEAATVAPLGIARSFSKVLMQKISDISP
jgi:hypothetical protein